MNKFDHIIADIQSEFNYKFTLLNKTTSKFMKFLFTIALMKYWNPKYMENYTVTLSAPWWRHWIFMPERLIGTDEGVDVLRHERVHMRDANGPFKWLWLVITYCILPIGPSGRAYWEFRGYKETMQAWFDNGGDPSDLIDWVAEHFTGPAYLYMWPFKNHTKKILTKYAEEIKNG